MHLVAYVMFEWTTNKRLKMGNIEVFDVSIPSLKSLRAFPSDGNGYEIVLNVPNFKVLDCRCYATRGYLGDIMGSLEEAYVQMELLDDQFDEGNFTSQFCGPNKVQRLSLSEDTTEGFLNKNTELDGIQFLPPQCAPVCASKHLKLVNFSKFLRATDEHKLVKYFLTNGLVLRTIVIWPYIENLEVEDEYDDDLEQRFAVSKDLFAFL